MKLSDMFEKFEHMDLRFEDIENPPSTYRDISAFLYLEKLLGSGNGLPMVNTVAYDQFWLHVDCDALEKVATDEDILYLLRCGVYLDRMCNCLMMFT
jgi:hypothetical protein